MRSFARTYPLLLHIAGFIALTGLAPACDSKVVSTGTGTGGSGGSVHVGAGSSGSMGKATTSASTGQDPALCDKFCAANMNCPYDCKECPSMGVLIPPCAQEKAALISCRTVHPDSAACVPSVSCESEAHALDLCQALQACVEDNGNQVTEGCSSGDGACYCEGLCANGAPRAECAQEPGGGMVCTCYLNHQEAPVGACEGTGPNPCDIATGCCAAFFNGGSG